LTGGAAGYLAGGLFGNRGPVEVAAEPSNAAAGERARKAIFGGGGDFNMVGGQPAVFDPVAENIRSFQESQAARPSLLR
jgi:hypothetical protein